MSLPVCVFLKVLKNKKPKGENIEFPSSYIILSISTVFVVVVFFILFLNTNIIQLNLKKLLVTDNTWYQYLYVRINSQN